MVQCWSESKPWQVGIDPKKPSLQASHLVPITLDLQTQCPFFLLQDSVPSTLQSHAKGGINIGSNVQKRLWLVIKINLDSWKEVHKSHLYIYHTWFQRHLEHSHMIQSSCYKIQFLHCCIHTLKSENTVLYWVLLHSKSLFLWFEPLQSGYGFDGLVDVHAEQTNGKGASQETISQ